MDKYWKKFFKNLKASQTGEKILSLGTKNNIKKALSPVATLTHILEQEINQEQKSLRIAWLSPETPETLDKGKWFGLISEMLPINLTIDFINPKHSIGMHTPIKDAATYLPPIATSIHTKIESIDCEQYDLIIISHPNWLKAEIPTEIDQLHRQAIQSNTRCYALFWSEFDAITESYGLLEGPTPITLNPFCVESETEKGSSWGNAYFKIPSEIEIPCDRNEQSSIFHICREHSGKSGFSNIAREPGSVIRDVQLLGSEYREDLKGIYIYVIDNLIMNKKSGMLFRLNQSESEEPLMELVSVAGDDHRATIPESNSTIIEKYLWACKVKISYYMESLKNDKDDDRTIKGLQKLVDLEQPDALYALGTMYDTGTSFIKQNHELAITYFERAAKAGHSNAMVCMGDILHRDEELPDSMRQPALEYWQQAAKLQHTTALYNLGICYLEGISVHTNQELAMKYLKLAADMMRPEALYTLGEIAVSNNQYETAVKYWETAAYLGMEDAINAYIDLVDKGVAAGIFDQKMKKRTRHLRSKNKATKKTANKIH